MRQSVDSRLTFCTHRKLPKCIERWRAPKWATQLLIPVFSALIMASSAYGQQGTGGVTGTVTDPTGAVVVGATVTISNLATNVPKTVQTNGAGIYRFDFAAIGKYNLKISAEGFADYKWDGFVVTVGQLVSHNVTLQLGKTGTVATVEAEGVQMVNTANAEISSLVGQTTIQNLPLEVRDATVFVNLVPGSVPASFNASLRGASINGMRASMGNFMLDGTDNNDYNQGGHGKYGIGTISGAEVSVSPDAVQEFRVVTNDFSAEYGRSGGFVTDLVTKSGTNQLHGSLFEYNRNSATTADDFFSRKAGVHDQLIRNQFGGSIGGPIKKDKMFIFGAVEWQRMRSSSPYTSFSFTQQFLEYVDSGAFANFLNSNLGAGLDCSSPSNPGCSLGPIFKQLQSKYHIPTATSLFTNVSSSPIFGGTAYDVPMYGQVTYSQSNSLNEFRPDIRFEYNISSKDALSVHYNMDNYPSTQQAGGGDTVSPGIPGIEQGRAQNAGMSWTRTITPNMVNEAKVGYLRSYLNFPCVDCQVPSILSADAFGFAFGSSSARPVLWVENTFQYQDRLSIIHGKHTINVGAEYRRTRNGSGFNANANGLYYMWDMENLLTDGAAGDAPGIGAGMDLYAQAAVNPSSPTPAYPEFYRGFRASEYGFYGENQIKAKENLTVTIGLRWDYFGVPHNFRPGYDSNLYDGSSDYNQCRNNASGHLRCFPGNTAPTAALVSTNPYYPINPYTASVFSGQFQIKNSLIWNKDTNNFAPRFGLAWDINGNQKTILRMGGGMFYDRMFNNIFENIRFNGPNFAFAQTGAPVDGQTQGPFSTPGFYSIPISLAQFAPHALTPSARQMDGSMKSAYDEQVNFNIQRQIGTNWMLDAAYVATFGHQLPGIVDVSTFNGRTVGHGYSSSRINPQLGSDNARANWFNSNYHSLQLAVTKRISHDLQFNANYTYSHALDSRSDVLWGRFQPSGNPSPEDQYNRYLEYGNADFNLAHRFVAYGVWDLPIFKGHKWLGGWSYDATFSIQSGQPFSIVDGALDSNKDGYYGDRAEYFGVGRPMNTVSHRLSPADGYIDPGLTSLFGPSTAPSGSGYTWVDGFMGRNVMTGPGYIGTDMSLAKKFRLNERFALKIVASGFNIFNHPNFDNPDADISHASFGRSLSDIAPNNTSTGARVMQFAARLDF